MIHRFLAPLAAAILAAGCGLLPDPAVRLAPSRPEVAAYVERYHARQDEYRIEVHWRESPARSVLEGEAFDDLPSGQVVGTNPSSGQNLPKDTVIQMQVSRGNQFTMPNLVGQFWVDAEPNLRALGWTGVLIKGPNVDNRGQRSNAVVTQSPSSGTGVNYGASITLSFAS